MPCFENPVLKGVEFREPVEWGDVVAEVLAHPGSARLFDENRPGPVLHEGEERKPVAASQADQDEHS